MVDAENSHIKAQGVLEYVAWQMKDKGIMQLDEDSPFQLCLIQAIEYASKTLEDTTKENEND